MGSESSRSLLNLIILMWLLRTISLSSEAHKFYVGGKDGWVTKPSEDYHRWAQRNRFQVNDTICFKYKKGSDSVLVVKKEDYDSCNTKSPIQKMEDGDSSFNFNRSGPFYFISGKAENCVKGQKLIVVVMAVRDTPQPHHQSSPPAAPSPGIGYPQPSEDPAPAPSPSGSMRLGVGGSMGVALGVSIAVGVNLIFMSICGLV